MRIITLTTDLGTKDSYLASVKGSIYSQLKEVNIIDISHDIDPFNIQQAAYILRNCFTDFPIGTVHLISIDDELAINKEHVAVKANDHYFVGADNGFFSLLFNEVKPEKIVKLNISLTNNCMTFAAKNIFVPAACHLARGGLPSVVGKPINDIVSKQLYRPIIDNNTIKGMVCYIDKYGNLMTNITKQLFKEVGKNRTFRIYLTRSEYSIQYIHQNYNEVPEGERVALFSSTGLLEIAINKGVRGSGGGASQLFGISINDIITVEFKS